FHKLWSVASRKIAAFMEGVNLSRGKNTFDGNARIAPPGQAGRPCQKENIAKQPLSAQTGWLFNLEKHLNNHPGASRHPSWAGGDIFPTLDSFPRSSNAPCYNE